MLRKILVFGTYAGLIVGSILFGTTVGFKDHPPLELGMVIGYASMLIALSMVFVGVKRHRDIDRGGVIRFWPAFGMGLAISIVAGVFYVLAWEAAVAVTGMDFGSVYANILIEQQKAQGMSGEALAKFVADMEQFQRDYANPFYRMPMTFTEIFPVGVLVSLISAALLRNSRFMALKRA